MGHIKLAKANGEFDVVSADNVGSVTIKSNKVVIEYLSGYEAGITCSSPAATGDTFKVVQAIDIMEGASGPAPLVELSTKVTGTYVIPIS